MEDRIEIPEANLANIAIFPEFPSETVVIEIKNHVRSTGKPHTWRGHSHTKPPKGARVLYREEFDVPTFGRALDRVAPCPCCRPRSRVYKNGGKIAWFPDEQVIRLIGPECFKALNPDGHDQALADLRRRQRRDADLRTVVAHAALVADHLTVIEELLSIADGVDGFETRLKSRLRQLGLDLWSAVRTGELRRYVRRRETFRKADGTTGERTVEDTEIIDRIPIPKLLAPSNRSLLTMLTHIASGLSRADEKLRSLAGPGDLPDDELRTMRDLLVKGRAALEEAVADADARRGFLDQDLIRRLSRWGALPDAVASFRMARTDEKLTITVGREVADVRFGAWAVATLPTMPPLPEDGSPE